MKRLTDEDIKRSVQLKSCTFKTKCSSSGKGIMPNDLALFCTIDNKYYHLESDFAKIYLPQRNLKLIGNKRLKDMKPKNYSGRDLGDDFKEFFRKEKNRITRNLKEMGCTDIQMSYGFYYFSGFFTSASGQVFYFSCSDVRHFGYNQLLYRTAKDYKDYSGGGNNYIEVNNLKGMRLI